METFKKQLSNLADFALEIHGLKNDYNREDMINATLVFFEVFSSLMYDCHRPNLSNEQMEVIFEEAGISLRQTIKLFTGIDTNINSNKSF